MAKVKVYLRVAKTSRGYKVSATTKPSYVPLSVPGRWSNDWLPTIGFGLLLDIPDGKIEQASEIVAELKIDPSQTDIAVEVADA